MHDSVEDRFWRRVEVNGDGCWSWTGSLNQQGYARIRANGRKQQAHRVAWEVIAGREIADGLHLDHLCRNRGCVNPDHLEPVTSRENTRRGVAPSAVAARMNMCVKGVHALEGDNVYVKTSGKRECRACALETRARYREANREKVRAWKRAAYRRNPEPAKAASKARRERIAAMKDGE